MCCMVAISNTTANSIIEVTPVIAAYSRPFFQPSLFTIKGRKRTVNSLVAIPKASPMAEACQLFFKRSKKASKTKKIITPSKCTLPVSSVITSGFKIYTKDKCMGNENFFNNYSISNELPTSNNRIIHLKKTIVTNTFTGNNFAPNQNIPCNTGG